MCVPFSLPVWSQPTAQGLGVASRYPLTPPLQPPYPCTPPHGSLAFPLTPWSPLPPLSFPSSPLHLGDPSFSSLASSPSLFPLPLSGHTLAPPFPRPKLKLLISVFVFIGCTITIMGSLIIAMNIHSAGVALGLGKPRDDWGWGRVGEGALVSEEGQASCISSAAEHPLQTSLLCCFFPF